MTRHVYLDTEFIPADPTTAGLISIGLTDQHGRDYYAVNANINDAEVRFHPWLGQNVWPYLPHNAIGGLDIFHPDVKPIKQIRADITRYFADHEPAHLFAWYGGQDIGRLHSLWGNDWAKMPEDIPQWFHELQSLAHQAGNPQLPQQDGSEHHALADAKYNRQLHAFLLGRQGPRRGDAVEAWLKAQRDASADYPEAWQMVDGLLDLYRLHADTGTPLDQHVCERGTTDDCEDCYEASKAGPR